MLRHLRDTTKNSGLPVGSPEFFCKNLQEKKMTRRRILYLMNIACGGGRMQEWKRPEYVWRLVLLLVLVLFGLTRLPSQSVPSSGDLQLTDEVGEKLVALTFDDGPRPGTTDRLLDGLCARGVKATFFLVGTQIPYAPELVERMAREGHQIGVHTLEHTAVSGLSEEAFRWQVEGERQQLYALVGERELWLRPPYGSTDDNTARWADSPVVLWSVDPEDWKDTDVDRITRHILDHTGDGDIILMHDIYPSSVDSALEAVDGLRERGFCFVTVAELLERRGIAPRSGQIYRQVRW